MKRIPLFFEVLESKDHAPLQICRKVMAQLFRHKIAPLPFSASVNEARMVLGSMRTKGMPPAIFLINTYWAEEMLPELDPMIGQTPVIFFRRNMFSATTSSMIPAIDGPPTSDKTSMILKSMTPRLTSIWGYGTKSGDTLAVTAAEAVMAFLQDGNFSHIERASPRRGNTLQLAMSSAQQNINEFRHAFDAPLPKTPGPDANAFNGAPASVSGSRNAAPRGLHGSLEQMGLSTLLLMIEMEKKSGELVLKRNEGKETGRLYLKKGRVVAAYAEGESVPPLSRSGPESVYFALTWTLGEFDFLAREIEMEDKINAPTTSLLMEGARRMDEPDTAGA